MTELVPDKAAKTKGPLVYRQSIWTRLTHWSWVVCLFFLLFSGLQIFNAHPTLYIGQQSGFEFDNAIFSIGAVNSPQGPRGVTTIFGQRFDTTGVLGMSGSATRPEFVGFPGAVTIPSFRDLATGRVVHFFFGWIFVATMLVWFVASFFNGHIERDIVPRGKDWRGLPGDILNHFRFRFSHGRRYSPLQKLSYFLVFVVLFPAIILTGLCMSPGLNAAFPWMLDIFGGRQTARTIHFIAMALLVLFFLVHVIMVVLAGPINSMRSMITGHYRLPPDKGEPGGEAP